MYARQKRKRQLSRGGEGKDTYYIQYLLYFTPVTTTSVQNNKQKKL